MINIALSIISILLLITREFYYGRYLKLGGSGKPFLAQKIALILEALLAALTITLLAIIGFNIHW